MCVFPWKYQGILRNGCITQDDPDGRFWCSTKLDSDLEHDAGVGNWGYCKKSCIDSGN